MEKGNYALPVAVIAIVIAVIAAFVAVKGISSDESDTVGATGTRFPNGLSANTSSPSAGQLRGTSLLLDTSNAATSTAALGCIQTYATSTQTPIVLTLTPYAGTTTTSGTNSNFLVAARYGSCPI